MNTRPYHMGARAAAAAETAERILDGALELYAELPVDQIRLEALAERAQVTVPTVVRRFGGKPGIVCALVERELSRLAEQRSVHADDATAQIVRDLIAFYESHGALILKVYAEATLVPGLPALAARMREYHVAWCRQTFAERIRGDDAATRRRRIAQVVAICDATAWRILREDGGLDAHEVERALIEMLEPLTR